MRRRAALKAREPLAGEGGEYGPVAAMGYCARYAGSARGCERATPGEVFRGRSAGALQRRMYGLPGNCGGRSWGQLLSFRALRDGELLQPYRGQPEGERR